MFFFEEVVFIYSFKKITSKKQYTRKHISSCVFWFYFLGVAFQYIFLSCGVEGSGPWSEGTVHRTCGGAERIAGLSTKGADWMQSTIVMWEPREPKWVLKSATAYFLQTFFSLRYHPRGYLQDCYCYLLLKFLQKNGSFWFAKNVLLHSQGSKKLISDIPLHLWIWFAQFGAGGYLMLTWIFPPYLLFCPKTVKHIPPEYTLWFFLLVKRWIYIYGGDDIPLQKNPTWEKKCMSQYIFVFCTPKNISFENFEFKFSFSKFRPILSNFYRVFSRFTAATARFG